MKVAPVEVQIPWVTGRAGLLRLCVLLLLRLLHGLPGTPFWNLSCMFDSTS